ncbi:unnamed protein product [Urochloa decumbens]|uniref:Uncharacterized protein n=1 Tax=Urochloa decumbens TaxID=240449 RepID=A0ABC9AYN9_9POAL
MSGRPMEAIFTPDDGSFPVCLGCLDRSVIPIAWRTRSASRQQTTASRRANLRWHFASGKCTCSPVEVTSGDDEHSHDPEYSAIKKSNKELHLLQMVSRRTNHGSSGKVVTHFKKLREKAASKKTCNQHCSTDATVDQEECMALDSEASFEDRNIIHSKMKANLEDAQSCQNRIVEAKSEYAKYLEKKYALEANVLEKRTSLSQMHSLLDENDKAIAELEQKLGHHRLQGQKIEKDMEHKESEIERLKEALSGIDKACYDYKQLFSRIMEELKQMHNE